MALRLEVKYKIPDARAGVKLKTWQELGLSGRISGVELGDIYTIDAKLPAKDLEHAATLLHNHVFQSYSWQKALAPKVFDWAVEVAFLPGVTDNIATTTRETLEDGLRYRFKRGEGIYTSQIFYLRGRLSPEDVQKIADSLYNPLIQSVRIKDAKQFRREKGMGVFVPKVTLKSSAQVNEVNLWVRDADLVKLGQEGIANPNGTRRGPLALDLDTLKTIRTYFYNLGREPSDVELETLAQTWSEHCKHTIFADPLDNLTRGIFKTYIQAATEKIRRDKGKNDFCVSVFKDNSGGIKFGEDYVITHKVETHNSPSALDPFGGAITGIVGVNRDTLGFGMGAKPVVNVYGFCFSEPNDQRVFYRDAERAQPLLPSRRIMEGVIRGVNVGGNCSGIPTPQGFLCFDSRFRGKPMVFVGTVGLIPRFQGKKDLCEKRARPGDYIVMVGGRVGLDGIHGATFSSVGLDKNSPATAVQIGDPITQKKMSDAIVKEARDLNLYTSITD
ncbi:MAG TPA: AIR synthase related protein, partial [Candidatus Paceibacterota bacterium]